MAMKKSTPGRAGTSAPISSGVKVLGGIDWALSKTGAIRKGLTPAQSKEAAALGAKIKALEIKAANEKKANAKIIKEQNKKPLKIGAGSTKPETSGGGKKPVIKLTPPKGGRGMGGMLGGGSLTSRTK
jgi:hypothetical protein